MRTILVCALLGACFFATSQNTGLLVSDARYQGIPLLPTYSGVKYNEIPVRVSLKKYCPIPGDQGKSGACVGWAVGYGALSIQRAILNNMTDPARITQMANSAAFLYNQIKQNKTDCAEGAFLEDALGLVKTVGDCLERSFNYTQQHCNAQPDAAHIAEAAQYRVRDFATVFAIDEEPKQKTGKACKILATQTPLVVGLGVTKSFFDILPGTAAWNPDATESLVGHHAMVLVGYNSVEKYFELFNSFGASWGQNGFIRLPFDDFERLCRYAYVIVPSDAPTQAVSDVRENAAPIPLEKSAYYLGGEFVFRQPAGFVSTEAGDELMYFEEVGTRQDPTLEGFYQTEHPFFTVGDVFQLVAREVPRGRYIYVFSQGPDGMPNQHFPRPKAAVASAGFVLEKNTEIVVPDEEHLLQLPMPGTDYLCILYCYTPISDFNDRLQRVTLSAGDFPRKMQAAFGDLLVEANNIRYAPNKMSFEALAQPEQQRIAVPMILKVQAK